MVIHDLDDLGDTHDLGKLHLKLLAFYGFAKNWYITFVPNPSLLKVVLIGSFPAKKNCRAYNIHITVCIPTLRNKSSNISGPTAFAWLR
jgi:hypothetical protein